MALLATTAIVSFGISIGVAQAQTVIDGGAIETVPGTQGTPWNIAGTLRVGQSSTGTLNIGAGGTVNDIDAFVGNDVGASGAVTVTGINARWLNSGVVTIGYAGTGQLTVSNQGHVSSQAVYLGLTSDGTGTVTVDGTGSDWVNSTTMIVGYSGTGTLAVSNQANVTTHDLIVASENGSTSTVTVSSGATFNSTNADVGSDGNGTMTVTGTGSSWINSLDLHIGVRGIGHLVISNGGAVASTNSVISFNSIASGVASTVTVTGPGSTWSNTGDVFVGLVGSGSLSIENGGAVSAANVYLGATQNAAGGVSVDGVNSRLTVSGEIHVGDAAIGTLTVTNGGKVTSQTGQVGFGADGIGSATINGAGSSWINSADLYVGSNGNGTLNILNGGLVTSVAGAVGLNSNGVGVVTVDGAGSIWANSSDLYVGGAGTGTMTISNKGAVSSLNGKIGNTGTGVVTVTGANSAWINTADLTVGNGGNGTLNIQNGAGVSNAQGYVGGAVGGTGVVNVTGPTSLWVNTANLHLGYAGDGTLNVSNGGAVSAVAATIGENAGAIGTATINGATTLWTNSSSLTVGDAGTGSLTISNGGYVSATTVTLASQLGSTGTLNIGAAAGSPATGAGIINAPVIQFGSGTGIVNFNHTETAYDFASSFSGAGTINQLAGNTKLTADSSAFTGATNVLGGRLAVNGSLENSIVTVSGGGILGGNGIVGGIIANAGGIIGPGNSIGTLTVNGNVSQAAGSIYQVEVTSTGQADLIHATGTATIANGALLSVIKFDAAPLVVGTQYTILQADGGVSGTFSIVNPSAFVGLSASYDPTHVYLDVNQVKTFASVGVTRNQVAVGAASEALGTGNALYGAVLMSPTDAAARAAFDQLSGEMHASVKGVLLDDSRFTRDAALNRLRASLGGVAASNGPVAVMDGRGAYASVDPTTDRFAIWGQGFGSWGKWDGNGNAAKFDRSTGGFIMGADANAFDTLRLGAFAGYSTTRFNVDTRNSSGSSDNYHVGLYGGTNWGGLALRSGVAYSWHDVTTTRNVAFTGFGDALKANYDAGTAQAFGELAYGFNAGLVALEPFANLAYVSLRTDGFTEAGGAAALTSASSVVDATFTTLGLRASSSFTVGTVNTTAKGSLGWRHAFGDTTPFSTFSFGSGSPFTITGVPIAQDAAVLDVGMDFNITPNTVFGVSYGGQLGSGMTDQTVRANFSAKF